MRQNVVAEGNWYGSRALMGTWKAFIIPDLFKYFCALIGTTIWREYGPCNCFGSLMIIGDNGNYIGAASTNENGKFISFRFYSINEGKVNRLRSKISKFGPYHNSDEYEMQFSHSRIAIKGHIDTTNFVDMSYWFNRDEILIWDLSTEQELFRCAHDFGFLKLGCFTIFKSGIGLENDGKLYAIKFSAF